MRDVFDAYACVSTVCVAKQIVVKTITDLFVMFGLLIHASTMMFVVFGKSVILFTEEGVFAQGFTRLFSISARACHTTLPLEKTIHFMFVEGVLGVFVQRIFHVSFVDVFTGAIQFVLDSGSFMFIPLDPFVS